MPIYGGAGDDDDCYYFLVVVTESSVQVIGGVAEEEIRELCNDLFGIDIVRLQVNAREARKTIRIVRRESVNLMSFMNGLPVSQRCGKSWRV